VKTFLELNKEKFKSIYIRIALAFTIVASLSLAIGYLSVGLPDLKTLLFTLLATTIGFPIIIMFLGYLVWLINRKARNRAYFKSPFNQLERIGFYNIAFNVKSKWSFTDEIKQSQLNGFNMTMNLSKEKGNTIECEILTEWKQLDKIEFTRIQEKFSLHNIIFIVGGFVKLFDLNKIDHTSVFDLQKELELYVELLSQEGFVPKKINQI